MLRSTYQRAAPAPGPEPLPAGWTEHKAPTGHTYYYNAETKQSTYTRPASQPNPEDLQIDYGAVQPDREVQASLNALDEFHRSNAAASTPIGHFTGGRSYQDRSRPNRQGDRPKSKVAIPDCEPWMLVRTKYGRRFVHNSETKESLWKFPSEVMMAVIDMDRIEWENKKKKEENKVESTKEQTTMATVQLEDDRQREPNQDPYDSDSYEEVEVTDDEDGEAEAAAKRQKPEDEKTTAPSGPVEFDEDDIAYQLAAMEQNDYDDFEYDEEGDMDEGLEMTEEDSLALFRSLLDEYGISPFSTFDSLIDTNTATANAIIADDRWTSLPNMTSRRQAFTTWSRDRVAEQKAQEANSVTTTKKVDPRVAYLRFLATNATPKLYWPEFKRKYRKEPEMKDLSFADKDREKLYREYITKSKPSDSDRRKDLVALMKSISVGEEWNRSTKLEDIPAGLEKDLRFYLLREKQRNELLEAHIATLPDL